MRNRARTLSAAIAALLLAGAAALCLFRDAPAFSSNAQCWKITRIENGVAVASCLEKTIPDEPGRLFPNHHNSAHASYFFEPIRDESNRAQAVNDRTIAFLLLLPPATLIVCVFRNVIGLPSFGIFAPALLGLSFREVQSPIGVFVILSIVTLGWWLRRGLNELHLLQVPRTALLLSCVVVFLLLLQAILGNAASAIALFPLVILTGVIERFWVTEQEDGAGGSFRTLASTLLISACIWALAGSQKVSDWMFAHPETLGVVMAAQILLGRYTGFRLLELYRFRAMLEQQQCETTGELPRLRLGESA